MKTALLATAFMWSVIIALVQFLMGCSQSFPIGKNISVESIKIEPCKKSVYRIERYV